jgi:muramoyltetrapeptide carboxypeptidase
VSIKPPRLKPGDGIGIVAPAGPVMPQELQSGLDLLESAGHRVIPSPHLFRRQGYTAGEDPDRLQDLHAMFADEKIRAIICARGGYGSLRLLARIDYDLIRMNPKILMGYSDITALLWTIYHKTGLVTFHGPTVKGLDNRKLGPVLELLASGGPEDLDLSRGAVIREGSGRGTLLGGNLSLICHLLGTPYMPSLKGAILFIEDRGEPLYRIDRMLTHLSLSGHLEDLAGCILGDFEDCGDPTALHGLVSGILTDLDIPVLSGLPAGHGPENIPLPLGLEAVLDTERMSLSFLETWVRE